MCDFMNVRLFFTISSVAVLVARLLTGKLMDRHGLGIVVIPSLIMGAASLILIGSAWSLVPIIIAGWLKGIGKWLLIAATFIISVSVAGYSFATSTAILFALRLLHGAAFAVSSTTHLAFATRRQTAWSA